MKVKRLIEKLQICNPNAEVKMHDKDGFTTLFVTEFVNRDDVVILEDASDVNLTSELEARFENAQEEQMDELDFFMELLDIGITLGDIKAYLPEKYEYSEKFMKEHGLV